MSSHNSPIGLSCFLDSIFLVRPIIQSLNTLYCLGSVWHIDIVRMSLHCSHIDIEGQTAHNNKYGYRFLDIPYRSPQKT